MNREIDDDHMYVIELNSQRHVATPSLNDDSPPDWMTHGNEYPDINGWSERGATERAMVKVIARIDLEDLKFELDW